jgi:hypothetical protein
LGDLGSATLNFIRGYRTPAINEIAAGWTHWLLSEQVE